MTFMQHLEYGYSHYLNFYLKRQISAIHLSMDLGGEYQGENKSGTTIFWIFTVRTNFCLLSFHTTVFPSLSSP